LEPEEIGYIPANEIFKRRIYNKKKIEEAVTKLELQQKELILNDNWNNLKDMLKIEDLI
jgi:hypothetical protein